MARMTARTSAGARTSVVRWLVRLRPKRKASHGRRLSAPVRAISRASSSRAAVRVALRV
jgi:hypothetical protein